jgi:hypothetical protein
MSLRTTATESTTINSASLEDAFSWPSFASLPSAGRSDKASAISRCQRSVSFDASVAVHLIPRRDAYSDRVKLLLWQSPSEMQENVARNCFEFASEDWDWQRVRLDDEMVEVEGGERVHPIHFTLHGISLESARLHDARMKSFRFFDCSDSDSELERDEDIDCEN